MTSAADDAIEAPEPFVLRRKLGVHWSGVYGEGDEGEGEGWGGRTNGSAGAEAGSGSPKQARNCNNDSSKIS